MRILSVVKRVPDSRATLSVKGDGSGIETAGLKYVCDPFDEFGIAQAVALRDARDDVESVDALAVGPGDVVEVLRFAIAMGADRAIHVAMEDLPGHDEIHLARVLAEAIKAAGSYDLILCGKQNIDNDAGELGPALAELLDRPHVGAVTSLEIAADGSSLTVRRRIEGAEEVVDVTLPALVTCEKGLIEPKKPPLPKLMKAKKAPVETLAAGDLAGLNGAAPATSFVRLAPPPAPPACVMIDGEPEQIAAELVRRLREEAKVL